MSSDSSSIWARRRSSSSSPVIENSPPYWSLPKPTPSVSRPPLSRSSVAVSRATFTGRRRASGVTIGPSRTRSVAVATAASVIHGFRHRGDRFLPAHVIPHEHPVPAGGLRLNGQPGDGRRVGELVEERQEQTGAHRHHDQANGSPLPTRAC